MAKVEITFEVDSIKELGSLMHSLGQTEVNDYITDIWVDLDEEVNVENDDLHRHLQEAEEPRDQLGR